ncbi:MAG: transglycosylase domain-containing protein, partial [Deltaproteobacteria bacterium]|nr:transglycosylase domain-containing protein [Deltaproteobacteria bacterium]
MGKETSSQSKSKKTAVKRKKASAGKKRTSSQSKRNTPWTHVHCILFLAGIGFGLTLFISFTLYLFILLDIPNLRSIKDYEPKMTTLVLASNNKVLKEIFEENRRVVALEMLPELLPKAFVAAEDARFYEHPGVDLWSIFRALFHNFRSGSRAQ